MVGGRPTKSDNKFVGDLCHSLFTKDWSKSSIGRFRIWSVTGSNTFLDQYILGIPNGKVRRTVPY